MARHAVALWLIFSVLSEQRSLSLGCAAGARRVAVVTGASRGIGRGIALGLAENKFKVYVTGRSLTPALSTDADVGGSLEAVCNEIEAIGGQAVAKVVDHNNDKQVSKLFEDVAAENDGVLDLLVNNAFGGIAGLEVDPFAPFWEQGAEIWDRCAGVGLRSHYIASAKAVPLLKRSTGTPLIVNVSSFGGLSYTFNVAYGVCKAAVDRLTADTAKELQPLGISTLSLWPGVVATERMKKELQNGNFLANTGMDVSDEYLETPLLVGRVVASLASESKEERLKRSGSIEVVAEVAKAKGIQDELGRDSPPSIRSLKFILPVVAGPKIENEAIRNVLQQVPDLRLPFWIMAGGAPS